MPRLLVFQHVAHELLGTLNPLLKDAGFRIRYVNFERHPDSRPQSGRYDGLVVLGGPMSANDVHSHPHLEVELETIQAMLDRGAPVLGICLGAQLLARALGARVASNPVKEIGWYDVRLTDAGRVDPLLSPLRPTERIFQWHGDTFEIPPGGVRLAESSDCANQAFRYGETAYGLQFHLEVDEPMIRRWLTVPANKAEIEALDRQIDVRDIHAETRAHIKPTIRLGQRVFRRFISLFGSIPRRRTLPSR